MRSHILDFYVKREGNQMFSVADAHCDFLYYMFHDDYSLKNESGNQAVSLPLMRKGGAALQFFAAWVDPDMKTAPLQQCLWLFDAYYRMLRDFRHEGIVPFTRDFKPESGDIATVLTVEGGEAIMGQEENLRILYQLGVKAMTLTWNATNELAHPAMSRFNRGLTKRGKTIVTEMDRIGMAVDVAHLSDAGIDDVLSIVKRPIFSSHTNSRAVLSHKRSLTDRQIRDIAKNGGVVCINYFPPQLSKQPTACIADIAKHILHAVEVGGIEHVALGSDFDGMNEYPKDLKNWADVQQLLEALLCAGLKEHEVKRIAYDNLRDYIIQFY